MKAATSFRRTSFVVQTKIFYAHNFFLAQKIIEICKKKIVYQNKAKNAGRCGGNAGMREIRQNAGFPTRLRDG